MLNFEKGELTAKSYCEKYNLNLSQFNNNRHYIRYKSKEKYPGAREEYEKEFNLIKQFLLSGKPRKTFSEESGIRKRLLQDLISHVDCVDTIERLVKERGEPSMEFIPVVNAPETDTAKPVKGILSRRINLNQSLPHTITEEKNSLEIIVTEGIKVSIAPNIETTKIIKIIEFLKGL